MKKSFKGFTLVEVLIVIIIVGILIAALLPRLVGAQARARDTAREGGLNQIAQGVALKVADNDTASLPANGAEADITAAVISTDYLSSIPVDPQGAFTDAEDGTCTGTAGAYCIHAYTGSYMVFNQSEQEAWNCSVVAATNLWAWAAIPAVNETAGTHNCVLVN